MTDPPNPKKPSKPQRPDAPDAAPARGSPAAAIATLVLGISAVVLLGFLVGRMMAIIAAVFAWGAIHYMLWGWWLGRVIRDEETTDDPPS